MVHLDGAPTNGPATGPVTDFERFRVDELVQMVVRANPATIEEFSSNLRTAADRIEVAALDLAKSVLDVRTNWKGTSADEFTDWTRQVVVATRGLGMFIKATSTQVGYVSQKLTETKSRMPNVDPALVAKAQLDTPAYLLQPSVDCNDPAAAREAARAQVTAAHDEAVAQLRSLTSTYRVASSDLGRLEVPAFPKPPAGVAGFGNYHELDGGGSGGGGGGTAQGSGGVARGSGSTAGGSGGTTSGGSAAGGVLTGGNSAGTATGGGIPTGGGGFASTPSVLPSNTPQAPGTWSPDAGGGTLPQGTNLQGTGSLRAPDTANTWSSPSQGGVVGPGTPGGGPTGGGSLPFAPSGGSGFPSKGGTTNTRGGGGAAGGGNAGGGGGGTSRGGMIPGSSVPGGAVSPGTSPTRGGRGSFSSRPEVGGIAAAGAAGTAGGRSAPARGMAGGGMGVAPGAGAGGGNAGAPGRARNRLTTSPGGAVGGVPPSASGNGAATRGGSGIGRPGTPGLNSTSDRDRSRRARSRPGNPYTDDDQLNEPRSRVVPPVIE